MKLVVHIGHGKTGSSSIQKSLLAAESALSEQRVKYLGLMLEHAQTPERKKWQRHIGSDVFFDQVPRDIAISELRDVLTDELSLLADQGQRLAIWSNEWILQRPAKVLPVLQDLQAKGIEIEIQAFIRRHDKWAISAYTQWGLRHKSNAGPLMDFDTWIRHFEHQGPKFGPVIAPWHTAFPASFRLMNFDAIDDVVQHFMKVNGLVDIPTINENVSPDTVELALHAVYNGAKKGEVIPTSFDRAMSFVDRWDQNDMRLGTLDTLFPSAEALAALVRSRAEDIAQVNALLVASGEPALSFEEPPKQVKQPAPWEVEQQMLKMIFALAEEVALMRTQIAELKKKVAGGPGS